MSTTQSAILARCQQVFPNWRGLSEEDFEFSPPKGFSSFTMSIRCRRPAQPPAVLYRHLAGKDNAILDFGDEKAVYLALAEAGVAAPCLAYEREFRLEAFYEGRSLTAEDLRDHETLGAIGVQLAKLHSVSPSLPAQPFFERVHDRWGAAARRVLIDERGAFPENEQAMCAELVKLLSVETREMVRQAIPDGPLRFCHNDTYHGNIMRTDAGEIRLLDFEFSCLNHPAFDFANLFAETVMRHGLADYPYFDVAEPEYTRADIATVVRGYVAQADDARLDIDTLVDQTESAILLSDYMYAMAATTLALAPIQNLRFIPYALTRFRRFRRQWSAR